MSAISAGALLFVGFAPGFGGRAALAQENGDAQPAQSSVESIGIAGLADGKAVLDWKKITTSAALPLKSMVRAPRIAPRPIPSPQSETWVPENGAEPPSESMTLPGPTPRAVPQASLASPAPSLNFRALDDDETMIPPDTQGTVGPNHLMVTLNSQVQIQDKTGHALSVISLAGFWSGLHVDEAYDPRVAYDPFVQRWIFSAGGEPESSGAAILIGVSQTSDPTDRWSLYRVRADASGQAWADFPTLGFNRNWIVVQANMFSVSGNAPVGSNVWAFNKADLYAGGTGTFTLLHTIGGFTQCPVVTYDNSLQTEYLVETFNAHSGKLRLSKIEGPVGSEILTSGVYPSTSNHWQTTAPLNFAPQSGSSAKIDTGDDRIMNCVYRNGSVWAAHTIFLPAAGTPTRSSAQWWQIDVTNGIGKVLQLGRIDDPSNTLFFAYPTIAVNKNNDALIGYSRFGAGQHPSANYSLRRAGDSSNTTEGDTVLKAGEAVYDKDFRSGDVRWGDFSNTAVDPVNDLDLWTIQEFASSGNRWGTWWGKLALADPQAVAPTPGRLTFAPARLGFRATGTGTGSSRSLTIRNTAPRTTLTGEVGSLSGPFSLTSGGGSFSLTSGQTITIEVQFAPNSPGNFSDTLHITTNDPRHLSVNVPIAGHAASGRLVIAGRVGFPNIISGNSVSRTFFIRNPGLGILHGSVSAPSGPFRVTAGLGSFALGHAESIPVTISFEPLARGPSSGAMSITSDDPARASVSVALSGSAR